MTTITSIPKTQAENLVLLLNAAHDGTGPAAHYQTPQEKDAYLTGVLHTIATLYGEGLDLQGQAISADMLVGDSYLNQT